MENWWQWLSRDPLSPLLASGNEAITYFARRDLLGVDPGPVRSLWELPEALSMLKRQRADGSWKYHATKPTPLENKNYAQLETYRQLRVLVEKHGFTRSHTALSTAAEFMFSFQTEEGDFRGIYGNQYSPNYSAGIMEILVKAGYEDDPRIKNGFNWLLSIRQTDGGWAIPIRTRGIKLDTAAIEGKTVQPDRSRPSSQLATGCVLRAFAADPRRRHLTETRAAGAILASRLMGRDTYPDRGAPSYWTGFTFPFWFTDLLSALDTLTLLGFGLADGRISEGVDWLREHQGEDGLWRLRTLNSGGDRHVYLWISLAVCRVLRRLGAQLLYNPARVTSVVP